MRSVCKWIIDLEATKHTTSHRVAFDTYKVNSPCNVRLGDDSVAKAIRIGSIVVGVKTRGIRNKVHIIDVLYVPKLQANLLSVSKLLLNGLKVQFLVNECIVGGANGDVVVIAQCEGNLYQMTFMEVCVGDAANFVRLHVRGGSAKLWHHRFGHLNVRRAYAF